MTELNRRNLPYLSESLNRLPRFINCPRGSEHLVFSFLTELDSEGNLIVAKTGMGSSAALTTSLVGSLLQFFGVISLQTPTQSENNHRIVHNLAQLVHAVAQGKIGSGFDVAAAVYGSQIYRRFSDTLIPFDEIMNNDPSGKLLYQVVESKSCWDQYVLPFNLPNGIEIMMGDVCGGSSSSSMV
jgi:phosphomevalonate kinase